MTFRALLKAPRQLLCDNYLLLLVGSYTAVLCRSRVPYRTRRFGRPYDSEAIVLLLPVVASLLCSRFATPPPVPLIHSIGRRCTTPLSVELALPSTPPVTTRGRATQSVKIRFVRTLSIDLSVYTSLSSNSSLATQLQVPPCDSPFPFYLTKIILLALSECALFGRWQKMFSS